MEVDIIEYMFQLLLKLIGWIFNVIFKLIFGTIRIVFTNVYAFIVAVIIVVIVCVINYCSSEASISLTNATTELYSPSTTYVCTAKKGLKVRVYPNLSAEVIGKLQAGEEVEVYEFVDDFAKIQCNDGYGYASIKYLQPKLQ